MAGWAPTRELLAAEWRQLEEEGRDLAALDALRPLVEAAQSDDELEELHRQMLATPPRAGWAFDEPNDLAAIRPLRNGKARNFELALSDSELFDKLHGAWLGRCAGCALGKPVEGFLVPCNGMSSWQRQRHYLTAISADEWPLRDYFPAHSPGEDMTARVECPLSQRENIAFMEADDDIRYTVVGQIILETYGRDFSTWHVMKTWFDRLNYSSVCSAETQAFLNVASRYAFHNAKGPFEVDWEWAATRLNPYREWIGAQIRVDSYAYAAPGNPELAAEWAWRDARLSHVKNGIYGAMFCAAVISAAFATDDVHSIIEAGLAQIPTTSRLYAELRATVAICAKYDNDFTQFEAVLYELYGRHHALHPVHTINNAALCVAAVLLSGGDFEKGITLAVMGGLDTDCNGATVGSVVGAICGARNAPAHWVGRLHDTLNAEIVGYHPISIDQCARRSFRIARSIVI